MADNPILPLEFLSNAAGASASARTFTLAAATIGKTVLGVELSINGTVTIGDNNGSLGWTQIGSYITNGTTSASQWMTTSSGFTQIVVTPSGSAGMAITSFDLKNVLGIDSIKTNSGTSASYVISGMTIGGTGRAVVITGVLGSNLVGGAGGFPFLISQNYGSASPISMGGIALNVSATWGGTLGTNSAGSNWLAMAVAFSPTQAASSGGGIILQPQDGLTGDN